MVNFFTNLTVNFNIRFKNFFGRNSKNENAYATLIAKTRRLYSLVNELRRKIPNNISASVISFSYSIDEQNFLKTTIDIDGIKNKINTYFVHVLGNGESVKVVLVSNNICITPSSINSNNNFTVYSFNLNKQNTSHLKVCITDKMKNADQDVNLYFIPMNYLKNVDIIKINSNNRQIKYYRANDNQDYEDAVILEGKDSIVLKSSNDKNYVKSIFYVPNYKRTTD